MVCHVPEPIISEALRTLQNYQGPVAGGWGPRLARKPQPKVHLDLDKTARESPSRSPSTDGTRKGEHRDFLTDLFYYERKI